MSAVTLDDPGPAADKAAGVRSFNRVLALAATLTAAMMQTIDATIVNVALPQMQGQLGSTTDEIGWVLTSYIVATAVVMPLSGYLTDRFGQKRLLIGSIAGFIASSLLCGTALNVNELVIFRLLQGISGATMGPIAQAIILQLYTAEERPKAMAYAGIGMMVGPLMGPTLGGWITDLWSWRWAFFINVPFGLAAIALALRHIPDSARQPRSMDWVGFALLGLAVAAGQYTLDRGNRLDWFESSLIVTTCAVAAAALLGFVVHSLRARAHPIFNFAIFRDWNYSAALITTTVVNFGMMGSMVIHPFLLQSVYGYPPMIAGELVLPRGVALIFGMATISRLTRVVDPRAMLAFGMIVMAIGQLFMSQYGPQVGIWSLVWPGFVQGFGTAFAMVPLTIAAYTTLAREHVAEAAGMYNLMRNLGAAIGVATTMTVLERHTQIGWQHLGGQITAVSPAVSDYLGGMNLPATDPMALQIMAREVGQQAQLGAIVDSFKLVAVMNLVGLPLLFCFRFPLLKPSPG
ncbi:MAG: DHA2 family efflux MFS transporter permease subunit [Gammaproteobacteria bacterium]